MALKLNPKTRTSPKRCLGHQTYFEALDSMRRRSFLTQSAVLGLGTALTHFPGSLPSQQVLGSTPESIGGLTTIRSLKEFERASANLKMTVVKGLDLRRFDLTFWKQAQIEVTYFLGCSFKNREVETYLESRKAFLLRRFDGLEYDPYRSTLYSPDELMTRTASGMTKDEAIYKDYLSKGKWSTDLVEVLTRRIHDFSMDDCLEQLPKEIGAANMVCITGGFFQERTDPWFRKIAETARLLTLDNKFVVTGGGPGIMEGANLGAYLAGYNESALDTALAILGKAPQYTNRDWQARSSEAKEMFPKGRRSLGIPTWFYGFEPPNIFASDIAKYFDNSIREGVLMSIAKAGFVFAPGSAGARQEIFMAATQNHFGTTGYFCPMVFLGKHHYQVETHVFQLVNEVANANYRDLLYITDDPADVVRFIREHPPRKAINAN